LFVGDNGTAGDKDDVINDRERHLEDHSLYHCMCMLNTLIVHFYASFIN